MQGKANCSYLAGLKKKMDREPITKKEIEQYLAGELSPEYLAAFEERLREDAEAKSEVAELKKIIEGIHGHAFKEKLREFHRRNFPDDIKRD